MDNDKTTIALDGVFEFWVNIYSYCFEHGDNDSGAIKTISIGNTTKIFMGSLPNSETSGLGSCIHVSVRVSDDFSVVDDMGVALAFTLDGLGSEIRLIPHGNFTQQMVLDFTMYLKILVPELNSDPYSCDDIELTDDDARALMPWWPGWDG